MHWLKLILNKQYREATKTANQANQLFADILITNKSVRRGG